MHKMENTPMIITIIGLVFEGIAAVTLGIISVVARIMYSNELISNSLEVEFSAQEYIDFILFMKIFSIGMIILTIILMAFLIVNLYLFPRLMKGKYTEEQAKKIYLYQAIWGGINLVMNQITGILYLISGVQGYNGRKDTIEVRDGL